MAIDQSIVTFIEKEILPLYASFDKAHDLSHARKVIQNSLSIAKEHDVSIDMVYVIAAYHDIGLQNGRDNHEKSSGDLLRADTRLARWFSPEELRLMAEAVEDHRASNTHPPRSLYGCIVSEADRDIDYITILTRTIQYSLEHFAHYTPEQHFERTYAHIRDKYGEGGYLNLWLNTKHNQQNLNTLRQMIHSKDALRVDFDRIYRQEIGR